MFHVGLHDCSPKEGRRRQGTRHWDEFSTIGCKDTRAPVRPGGGSSLRAFSVCLVNQGRHRLRGPCGASCNRGQPASNSAVHRWGRSIRPRAPQRHDGQTLGDSRLQGLLPFARSTYGHPSCYKWIDADGVQHDIHQHEGGEQGDPLMPLLSSSAIHNALAEVREGMLTTELLFAFLDDLYLRGVESSPYPGVV